MLKGLNEIVKALAPKKRVQLNGNSTSYWNNNLAESPKNVKHEVKIAHNTGTPEDKRDAKNARNVHSRKVKTRIKEFLRKKF